MRNSILSCIAVLVGCSLAAHAEKPVPVPELPVIQPSVPYAIVSIKDEPVVKPAIVFIKKQPAPSAGSCPGGNCRVPVRPAASGSCCGGSCSQGSCSVAGACGSGSCGGSRFTGSGCSSGSCGGGIAAGNRRSFGLFRGRIFGSGRLFGRCRGC